MTGFPARATLAALVIAATIGWTHGESQAITYTYAGVCVEFCDRIGLSAGDPVSGSVTFLDAALVPGTPYPAPLSLSLDFGIVHITEATVDELGLFGVPPPGGLPSPAIVPVDLTTFPSDVRADEEPVAPATASDVVLAEPGTWFASPNGNCSANCLFAEFRGDVASGSGAWSGPGTSVPEPATVLLLSVVVAGTACVGWRHRRSRLRAIP